MPDAIHTLAVDDEPGVCTFIAETLGAMGHDVQTVSDGVEALGSLRETRFDLVVLDLMLGGRVDGLRILEAIRWRWPNTAVIILTGHGSMASALEAIREGVDGYLLKPVAPAELRQAAEDALARRAVLRSEPLEGSRVLKRGPFSVDPDRHTIHVDGERLDLTPQEFRLLTFFLENAGRVIPPTELAEVVQHRQATDIDEARQTIRWHVYRLRQKIEPAPSQPKYILNVRGVGYTFRA